MERRAPVDCRRRLRIPPASRLRRATAASCRWLRPIAFRAGLLDLSKFSSSIRNLEPQLQTKLDRARPMRIERVQERRTGHAIGSIASESRGINRPAITTDDVVARTPWVIRIVNSELRVIENIERFSAELQFSRLANLEMFQQRHVKVDATGIVQEIPARISKREAAWRYKLRRIADERPKAFRIANRRLLPLDNIRKRSRDPESAGNSGIVGQRNPSIAGAVDHGERSTGLKQGYAGKLPSVENAIRKR